MILNDAIESDLLRYWREAFTKVYGEKPELLEFDPPAGYVGPQPLAVRFPPVIRPIEMIGGTGHFRHNEAMVRHVRSLGFDWNEDGRVLTSPTPATFNALVGQISPPNSGFKLVYYQEDSPTFSLGGWLLRYMDGVLSLLVGSEEYYDRMLADGRHKQFLGFHFASLAHDLTVHALNYHLVPHEALSALAEQVRETVPERASAWAQPKSRGPLTLTMFWDNDFNRYGYRVWSRCKEPSQFRELYLKPGNFSQLQKCLAIRLEETQQGIGDVPSGNTDDMAPLQQMEFHVS